MRCSSLALPVKLGSGRSIAHTVDPSTIRAAFVCANYSKNPARIFTNVSRHGSPLDLDGTQPALAGMTLAEPPFLITPLANSLALVVALKYRAS